MSERKWSFYLDDMIGFAEKAVAYTNGLDQEGFANSKMSFDLQKPEILMAMDRQGN